jgi:hypothetical protein
MRFATSPVVADRRNDAPDFHRHSVINVHVRKMDRDHQSVTSVLTVSS